MVNNTSEISAVLVVSKDRQAIAETLSYLKRQTCRHRMEIVVTGPAQALEDVKADEYSPFASLRKCQLEKPWSLGRAYAAGVRVATSPIIVCCEDHAFPEPEWAEGLIAAHEEDWAAVGPAMRNGNPTSLTSWAAFLMGFAPWAVPCVRQEVTHLPWHNNSYKRDVLLEYGDRLSGMFEAESVLHWDLRSRGYRLCLEPNSQVSHLNVAKFRAWVVFQHYAGQKFGAKRSEDWSMARRLFYGFASGLIPVVRLARLLKPMVERGRCKKPILAVSGVVLLGLIADGFGQMRGYLFGIGRSIEMTAEFDLNRPKYL